MKQLPVLNNFAEIAIQTSRMNMPVSFVATERVVRLVRTEVHD